jgi:hypothetical protein
MRPAAARTAVLAAPAVLLVACTSSGPGDPAPSTVTHTVTGTVTRTASIGPTAPVSVAPTTASVAASCPLLPTQQAADRVGMRLAKITVLHSDGELVGCRFYALQNSPLHNSEHLPGPNQPAIQITTTRYASPDAAHNAFVLEARRGRSPQQAQIGDTTGVCYQIPFYKHDRGQDWACSFNLGAKKVTIKTVVVTPALNVIEVSRVVARALA